MPRVAVVRVMDLPDRRMFIRSGGHKQDCARALLIGLLPSGADCYTAAELVKLAVPGRADHDYYVAQYRALDSLARKHGISEGDHPGPDNIDPATRKRLPGKRPGSFQPARWTRASWLNMVSDEVYVWLQTLNEEIKTRWLAYGACNCTARLYVELETMEIIEEIIFLGPGDLGPCWNQEDSSLWHSLDYTPSHQPLSPDEYAQYLTDLANLRDHQYQAWRGHSRSDQAPPCPMFGPSRTNPKKRWRSLRVYAILAAAAVLAFSSVLWPILNRNRVEQTPFAPISPSLAALDIDDYLARNEPQTQYGHPGPPLLDEIRVKWKTSESSESMLAPLMVMRTPPPMFLASNR